MNDELEKNLRQQLRASEDRLDAPTLARLHAARNRALGTAGSHRERRWPGAWLAAAVAAGAALIALFPRTGQSPDEAQLPVAELESTLLAAAGSEDPSTPAGEEAVSGGTETAETLDLIENLDFYEWLSQQETPEQPT